MTIGIGINVDAGRVRDAKREVEHLNRRLTETEGLGKDLSLGDGLEQTSDLVRRLSQDVNRLKNLADAGNRQGGLLRKEQFERAAEFSKKIRENFDGFSQTLTKAREELQKLLTERDKLEKIGASGKYESPTAFMRRQARLQELEAQIPLREKEAAALGKFGPRVGRLERTAADAGGAIAGFGAAGSSLSMKKALGVGAALLGGMSLVGFLNDSLAKEFSFGGLEADITRRGGRGLRRGMASYGFTPLEHLQLADMLSRKGLSGDGLFGAGQSAKQFARGRGTSGEVVAEYAGGIYTVSGARLEKQFEKLRDAVVNAGVGGRIDEFLQVNQNLIQQVAQGSGRELGGGQVDFLTGFQAALWSMGKAGQGEMGASLMGRLDQGIRSGGRTPGAQLFSLAALSGGPIRNIDEYYDYRKRVEAGLGDPDNLRRIYEKVRNDFGGTPGGGLTKSARMQVAALYGLNLGQADLLSEMGERGLFSKGAIEKFLSAKGTVAGDASSAMGLAGNGYRATAADVESLKLELGSELLPVINTVKDTLVDGARLFIEALRAHPIATLTVGTLVVGETSSLVGSGMGVAGGAAAGGAVAAAGKVAGKAALKAGARAAPWMAFLGDFIFPSEAGIPNEEDLVPTGANYHRFPGAGGSAEGIADAIARRLADELERQGGRVQKVEVVNMGSGASGPRGSGR